MNHIGAEILDMVSRLFSDEFSALDEYCSRYAGFLDNTIRRFERELQFYLSCLDYIAAMRSAGLNFCYPEVSPHSKDTVAMATFDLALAHKLVEQGHASGVQRLYVGWSGESISHFWTQSGRQDHICAVLWPVASFGQDRVPGTWNRR